MLYRRAKWAPLRRLLRVVSLRWRARRRWAMVTKAEGRYTALPIQQALEQLDGIWDDYFKYHNDAPVPRRAVG